MILFHLLLFYIYIFFNNHNYIIMIASTYILLSIVNNKTIIDRITKKNVLHIFKKFSIYYHFLSIIMNQSLLNLTKGQNLLKALCIALFACKLYLTMKLTHSAKKSTLVKICNWQLPEQIK